MTALVQVGMGDADHEVRRWTVRALGNLGDAAAGPDVVAALL
jgi:HEAT repeat protein